MKPSILPSFLTRGSSSLLLVVLAGAACGGTTEPEPVPDNPFATFADTYSLQALVDQPFPVERDWGNGTFWLHAGTIVLNDDGTCSNTLTTSPDGEAAETTTLDCTWTVINGSLFSYTEAGTTYPGRFYGGVTLQVNDVGNTWRPYTR